MSESTNNWIWAHLRISAHRLQRFCPHPHNVPLEEPIALKVQCVNVLVGWVRILASWARLSAESVMKIRNPPAHPSQWPQLLSSPCPSPCHGNCTRNNFCSQSKHMNSRVTRETLRQDPLLCVWAMLSWEKAARLNKLNGRTFEKLLIHLNKTMCNVHSKLQILQSTWTQTTKSNTAVTCPHRAKNVKQLLSALFFHSFFWLSRFSNNIHQFQVH